MAIKRGDIIVWKDVVDKLGQLISTVADNVPNNVDVSSFSSQNILDTSFYTDKFKQIAHRIVTQIGISINPNGVSVNTVKDDVIRLFNSNKYVLTPEQTVVAADDMYNIAYVIERFLNDSMHIYVSPYYKKKIIVYHSPSSVSYGKPVTVNKSYDKSQFQNFLNNLIDIVNSIHVTYNTYSRSIKFN